MADVSDDADMR